MGCQRCPRGPQRPRRPGSISGSCYFSVHHPTSLTSRCKQFPRRSSTTIDYQGIILRYGSPNPTDARHSTDGWHGRWFSSLGPFSWSICQPITSDWVRGAAELAHDVKLQERVLPLGWNASSRIRDHLYLFHHEKCRLNFAVGLTTCQRQVTCTALFMN